MVNQANMEYAAYAATYVDRYSKKIRLVQFLMIDAEGAIIAEGIGDTMIGFYEGRVSQAKIKEAVQSFARYELERSQLKGDVPVKNISLKDAVEIEQMLVKMKSDRYKGLQELR
jgi:hypothetical protein